MKAVSVSVLAILAVLAPHAARAQSGGGVSRNAAVQRACVAEVARLCPAESDRRSGRNQVICLRPYRSSLSPACRRAIGAMPAVGAAGTPG